MSRATISVPFRFRRVLIGYLESVSSTLSIPSSRSISTAGFIIGASAGRKRAGLCSSSSRKIPSSVIFALILRSAEQFTPIPTGHDAAWRGIRITRTSSNKVFAPELRPDAALLAYLQYFRLPLQSRKARPPVVAACQAAHRNNRPKPS